VGFSYVLLLLFFPFSFSFFLFSFSFFFFLSLSPLSPPEAFPDELCPPEVRRFKGLPPCGTVLGGLQGRGGQRVKFFFCFLINSTLKNFFFFFFSTYVHLCDRWTPRTITLSLRDAEVKRQRLTLFLDSFQQAHHELDLEDAVGVSLDKVYGDLTEVLVGLLRVIDRCVCLSVCVGVWMTAARMTAASRWEVEKGIHCLFFFILMQGDH